MGRGFDTPATPCGKNPVASRENSPSSPLAMNQNGAAAKRTATSTVNADTPNATEASFSSPSDLQNSLRDQKHITHCSDLLWPGRMVVFDRAARPVER